MSPRRPGPRSLALTILGLITLPILAGVAAGYVGAFGAGFAVSYVGLDAGTTGPTVQPTLYMPSFTPPTPTGPPMVTAPTKTLKKAPKATTAASASPAAATIQLVANPTSVSRKDRIGLTGTYRGGTGKVLQVQVFQGNKWKDFPVQVTVVSGSFSTFVITNQTGDVQFRVVDSSSGLTSNSVTVTIS